MKTTDKKAVGRDISSIFPYPQNAKKHPPEQIKKLAQSIRQFGWRGNPIIVDSEGVIIAGHGRRLAAIELGMTTVPVIVADDMTPDQIKAFRLADNRAAQSDFDNDLLKEELLSFDGDMTLLTDIFDKKELTFALVDVMEVDMTVFATDLDTVMEDTQNTTDEKIDASGLKRIPITKLLGFKDVSGADAIIITRFMAHLEAESGDQGEKAFIAHANSLAFGE